MACNRGVGRPGEIGLDGAREPCFAVALKPSRSEIDVNLARLVEVHDRLPFVFFVVSEVIVRRADSVEQRLAMSLVQLLAIVGPQ